MKTIALSLGILILAGGLAWAQQDNQAMIREQSKGIFSTILHIVLQWVFPVAAAYCFIYGVVGRGVKRGECDMAAICLLAAVGLALFPKILTTLFGVTLS